MKHLFIVNPTAGGSDKTAEVRARVEDAFRARQEPYELYVTCAPMDAARKIRGEAESGEPLRVYACGGDGTLNEVVCGAAGASNVAVTHWPCGSGNDFIKNFSEPPAFLEPERLLDAEEALLDLIQVGED